MVELIEIDLDNEPTWNEAVSIGKELAGKYPIWRLFCRYFLSKVLNIFVAY